MSSQFALKLLYGANAALVALAGVMCFGIVFLAGGHLLLMSVPLGIVFFTWAAISFSIKLKADSLPKAVGVAVAPLVFAPVWYTLIYKIMDTNCSGWSCF
ncbi:MULTISPECIES: hypothetical protein [unclassified Polaromonas]|uniref:hypothetical protein n=1 Tax=unclassified Polaromonas TaxID=2638319 RepID=UPI00129E9D66|nr:MULTISPECIES: hypothetical protein [unclassified Polaromonas]QGJ19652.1 hypothetical protein F7R28_15495 [Polaromonas sp. Pch-P]